MDELREQAQRLKDEYELARQRNTELNEKLHRQARKEQRLREEHKQATLQAETVNMMTKYQLVFVKMENQFAKVFHSNKLRHLRLKQEAFHRVKLAALNGHREACFKTHLVFERLRNRHLARLLAVFAARQLKRAGLAFSRWRAAVVLPLVAEQAERAQKRTAEGLQAKLKARSQELAEKEQQLRAKEAQCKALLDEYRGLGEAVGAMELRERHVAQEVQVLALRRAGDA